MIKIKAIIDIQKGMSLVEILVATAISAIISSAVIKTNQTGIQGVATVSSRVSLKMWQSTTLLNELSDPNACMNNLTAGGVAGIERENILDKSGSVIATHLQPITGTGQEWRLGDPSNSGLKPVKFSAFVADAPGSTKGRCDLTITVSGIKKSFGAKTKTLEIPISCTIDTSGNQIQSCSATMDASNDLWELVLANGANIPEHIGYSGGGSVLIGKENGINADSDDITAPFQINNQASFPWMGNSNGIYAAQRILGERTALVWDQVGLYEQGNCLLVGVGISNPFNVSNTFCENFGIYHSNSGATASNGSVIVASTNGGATGTNSAVIAGEGSSATGTNSSVFASSGGISSGNQSSIIASTGGSASGNQSSVVASSNGNAKGLGAVVMASSNSEAGSSGTNTSVIGSSNSNAKYGFSSVLASDNSSTNELYSTVVASKNSSTSGQYSAVIASLGSNTSNSFTSVIASANSSVATTLSSIVASQDSTITSAGKNNVILGGSNVHLTGSNSLGSGLQNRSFGLNSFVTGKQNDAIGNNVILTGAGSMAGNNSLAGGTSSFAMGESSFAFGQTAKVYGRASSGNGWNNDLRFNYSHSFGTHIDVLGANGFAIGTNLRSTGGNNLIMGMGSSSTNRHNLNCANCFLASYSGGYEFQTASYSVYITKPSVNPRANLGVGMTPGSNRLAVNGISFFNGRVKFVQPSAQHLYSQYNGSVVTVPSDLRVKKYINRIDDSLDIILKLDGKSYFYNNSKNNKKSFGFIAQEVETVIPELISEHDNGDIKDFKSINYYGFFPFITNAIGELSDYINNKSLGHNTEIQILEKENAQLKIQITKRRQLMKNLKREITSIKVKD